LTPGLRGINVTSYGTGRDHQALRRTDATDDNGSVLVDGFEAGSEACFVVKASGNSHLVWWQRCVTAEDRKTDLTINLESTKVFFITYKFFSFLKNYNGLCFDKIISLYF
jgi:hypothetical protein